MNDFTKDELKTIFGHLPIHTPERENSEKYQNIYKKLQSMIDNYCEHEWENICCQCTLDKIYCYKCEKDMGDLKQRYEE